MKNSISRATGGIFAPALLTLLLFATSGCALNVGDSTVAQRTQDAFAFLGSGIPSKSKSNDAHEQRLMSGRGQQELERAVTLMGQKAKNGERELLRVARHYKNSTAGEEAQFRLAESLVDRGRLAPAQDAYAQLLEDYPSTRFMDQATTRLFNIARYWLNTPDTPVSKSSAIQQVGHEDVPPLAQNSEPGKFDPTLAVPVLPNFHDRSRPVFDTNGRAIEALRTIWLSDPTGDLADDALMLTASHHLEKGDYVESDRYFKILREEYPRSPHLEEAFVLGSHVKLMSYQGSHYDGTQLAEARKLKENTLRLFPENAERDRLKKELTMINDADARRDWELVEYYKTKGKDRAVAVFAQQVIENHPNSEYANRARRVIQQTDPNILAQLPGFDRRAQPQQSPPQQRPYE